MTRTPRVCVDMDEVMADTLSEHLRRYNLEFNESVQKEDLYGKNLWDVVAQDRHQRLVEFLHMDDFFENLPVMPGAIEVLRGLAPRREVFIASNAMQVPNSLGPKYRWLRRNFPFLPPTNFVFCGDKSILRAEYLIDDLPHNILRFEGTGILFSSPHNLNTTGLLRADDWYEVQRILNEKEK
jgi:5'(3')-deoxyribonucleotidase